MSKTHKHRPLTPARIAAYRTFEQQPIVEQIEALNQFSLHHEAFHTMGHASLAATAERAWLEDAVFLAATMPTTPEEAHIKLTYLETCLDTWVASTARSKGHLAIAGMIKAAITADQARWGGAMSSSKSH